MIESGSTPNSDAALGFNGGSECVPEVWRSRMIAAPTTGGRALLKRVHTCGDSADASYDRQSADTLGSALLSLMSIGHKNTVVTVV